MQQWARDKADDRVTLLADLETIDLRMTATSQATLNASMPGVLSRSAVPKLHCPSL